jgi:hypothetical protein
MKITKNKLRNIIAEELVTMSEDTQKKVLSPSSIGAPPPKKVLPDPSWHADEKAVALHLNNPDVPDIEKKAYIQADPHNIPPGGKEWMITNYPDDPQSRGWKATLPKKVNESQDKLYQMVQEELEAVLAERNKQ